MYESPINIMEIQDSFVSEIKEKTEEMVFTEIKRIGIDINKEELVKALSYDRNQYEKGHSDGYIDAINEFVNLANQCSGYTENCIEHDLSLTIYTIHQIAEEMKKGGAE